MGYFIMLPSGIKVPVTEEVHEAYYEQERREKYHKRMKKRLHKSYDELSETAHPAEEQLCAPPASTEELAEREMTLEILLSALDKLTANEMKLLVELYAKGKSERDYAKSVGVSKTTVLLRRGKTLRKIRKLIDG